MKLSFFNIANFHIFAMRINYNLISDMVVFITTSFLVYWIMPRDFDFYNIGGYFSLAWPHTLAILYIVFFSLVIFVDYGWIAASDRPDKINKIRAKKIRWLFMIPSFLAGTYLAFAVDKFI